MHVHCYKCEDVKKWDLSEALERIVEMYSEKAGFCSVTLLWRLQQEAQSRDHKVLRVMLNISMWQQAGFTKSQIFLQQYVVLQLFPPEVFFSAFSFLSSIFALTPGFNGQPPDVLWPSIHILITAHPAGFYTCFNVFLSLIQVQQQVIV